MIKITGTANKPLQLIRRFKNERNPNVAATADLLTTDIAVPQTSNLVFVRRATRRCADIGKETFRVFDAVGIHDALQGITAMRPVVADPDISFTQLSQELCAAPTEETLALVRDEFGGK